MLEQEYIIYNSTLGICDFVTIDEERSNESHGWLEEPYDMVGPFCLDELKSTGTITFAQCIVISKAKWKQEQQRWRQDAHKQQYKTQQKQHSIQKEHRELLSLPIEGVLTSIEIKNAYRRISKTTHPDLGGEHEHFIRITQARDVLIEMFG